MIVEIIGGNIKVVLLSVLVHITLKISIKVSIFARLHAKSKLTPENYLSLKLQWG